MSSSKVIKKQQFAREMQELETKLSLEFLERRLFTARSQYMVLYTRVQRVLRRKHQIAKRRNLTGRVFISQLRVTTANGVLTALHRLIVRLEAERRRLLRELVELRYQSMLELLMITYEPVTEVIVD